MIQQMKGGKSICYINISYKEMHIKRKVYHILWQNEVVSVYIYEKYVS